MYGLAGLRVGFGVGSSEMIRLLNQPRSPFNTNLAAQVAATAAVNDDAFVFKTKSTNASGLKTFGDAFDRLGLPYIPSYANFVMVDVQRPCRVVFDALLRQGVIVRTGDVFGLPTFIRVTVGTPEQNAVFIAALEAVLPTIEPAVV
jgi:histidinol-phosphate aminotransferase